MTKFNERRDYVKELGLEHHMQLGDDCDVYVWPADKSGARYDRFVVIEAMSDGSAAIYLNASDLGGIKAKCVQLRRMVQI
jgi:hypothetical protein